MFFSFDEFFIIPVKTFRFWLHFVLSVSYKYSPAELRSNIFCKQIFGTVQVAIKLQRSFLIFTDVL